MEISKDNKTALVIGATGLIGKHLVKQLLRHSAYQKVVVFVRKKLRRSHTKLTQHIIDFDQLTSYTHLFKGDDLFCCLGTTMKKAGGDKEAFYKVDYTYAYQAAKMAAANEVNQYILVSSVGADSSSFFFYSRVKGELEEAINKLPFWAIHIFRPSVLLGERNENRWGERIAGKIGKGLDYISGGLLTKYKPIEAETVAKAMATAAQRLKAGKFIHKSSDLQEMSEQEEALRAYRKK